MDRNETSEKKKRSGKRSGSGKTLKIGVIDIVIIIAVIALIITTVLRYTSEKGLFDREKKEMAVTFSIKSARYTLYDMLEEGDKVYLPEGALLGTIKDITANPAVFYTEHGGEVIKTYYPENTKHDLNGTIVCELIDRDGRYVTADGVHVSAGTTLTVHTRTVDIAIQITALAPVE